MSLVASGGNAQKEITWVHARRQEATTVGNFVPQEPRAKASSAALAASALAAILSQTERVIRFGGRFLF